MELKLSDEQYEKIGRESVAEWQKLFHPNTKSAYIAVGRAAVDAVLAEVLPIVLADPSIAEVEQYGQVLYIDCLYLSPLSAKEIADRVMRLAFVNRLARFTAPGKDEKPVSDLLWKSNPFPNTGAEHRHDAAVWEAYERGLRAADREAGR